MQRSAADSVAGAWLTGALGESPSARARTPPPLARPRVLTWVRPAIHARHDSPPDDSREQAARAAGRKPRPDLSPVLNRGGRGAPAAPWLDSAQSAGHWSGRAVPLRPLSRYTAAVRSVSGRGVLGHGSNMPDRGKNPCFRGSGDRNIPQGVRPLSDYPGQDSWRSADTPAW